MVLSSVTTLARSLIHSSSVMGLVARSGPSPRRCAARRASDRAYYFSNQKMLVVRRIVLDVVMLDDLAARVNKTLSAGAVTFSSLV